MQVDEIEDAYAECVQTDRWPEGFNPFDAIRDLLREVRGYRRALSEHHNIANLSDEVIAGYDFRECQVCRDARRS